MSRCEGWGQQSRGSFCKARTYWFNVGDSRAYLCRERLRQLTKDHVPVGDTGPTSRRSHAITQSIGGRPSFSDVWPAAGSISVAPGDKIVICSDGLTDLLSDKEIEVFLRKGGPREIACNLRDTALSRGAPDNVAGCALWEAMARSARGRAY